MTAMGAKMTEQPNTGTRVAKYWDRFKGMQIWNLLTVATRTQISPDFSSSRATSLLAKTVQHCGKGFYVCLSISPVKQKGADGLRHDLTNWELSSGRDWKYCRLRGLADSMWLRWTDIDMIFGNFWENTEIAVKRCVDHFLSQPFRPWLKVSCF